MMGEDFANSKLRYGDVTILHVVRQRGYYTNIFVSTLRLEKTLQRICLNHQTFSV